VHKGLKSRRSPVFYQAYPVYESMTRKMIRSEIECNSTSQTTHLIKRPTHLSAYLYRRIGEGVTVSTNLLTNRILRDGVAVVRAEEEEEEAEERVEFLRDEGDELLG